MNSSAGDRLLFCNNFASSKLTCENKTSLLEVKDSLVIMRDQASSTRTISLITLYQFPFPLPITTVTLALVISSFLKFYLFSIVALLFLLNVLSIISSSAGV